MCHISKNSDLSSNSIKTLIDNKNKNTAGMKEIPHAGLCGYPALLKSLTNRSTAGAYKR